jgi:hypothetical protein
VTRGEPLTALGTALIAVLHSESGFLSQLVATLLLPLHKIYAYSTGNQRSCCFRSVFVDE